MYVDSAGVYVETAGPLEGGENLKKREDGIWWTTPKTSGMGGANTRYGGGQGLREKRKERCGKPRERQDTRKRVDQDRTPVSDLTAGVDG